eukprot:3781044-Amphidinium_carterae.1
MEKPVDRVAWNAVLAFEGISMSFLDCWLAFPWTLRVLTLVSGKGRWSVVPFPFLAETLVETLRMKKD